MLPNILAWVDRCKSALALAEYEITLSLVEGLEALGLCVADATYQIADIAIRDPSDGSHPDWERTILHELVHVRMGGALGTAPGSEERSALERGVEMMTRVLYKMIKGGATQRAISNAARLCARTIATAREGNEGRMNGARIAEIAMSLGGMDLPEEAKALVTELIGLASGGEPTSEGDELVPEKDPAAAIPSLPADQEKMYRALMGDKNYDTFRANAAQLMKAQQMQLARATLGAALTPHDENVINKLSPEAAAAYVQGLKRGTSKQAVTPGHKPPNEPPVKDNKTVEASTLLKLGESLDGAAGTKRVAIEVLEARAATRKLTIGKVA
jgi:hypothetical protein